jgi:hypothetical protein
MKFSHHDAASKPLASPEEKTGQREQYRRPVLTGLEEGGKPVSSTVGRFFI